MLLSEDLLTGIASAQPPEVAQSIIAILANEETADSAIDALPMDELLKQELRAMSRNTIAPTILHAGSQINVIPSEAEVSLDARILSRLDYGDVSGRDTSHFRRGYRR